MGRKIAALLVAAGVCLTATPAAEAAPYLPMWKGRQVVRKALTRLADETNGDGHIAGCWRVSRSRITCSTVIEFWDVDGACEMKIGARRYSYGTLATYSADDPECY